MSSETLIKKYGKRYAYEWMMRAQDARNLELAKNYADKKCKKITAIAATNAVMTILLLIISLKRHRSR